MPEPKWRMKGQYVKSCNCAFGCPCDFNAKPTYGDCKAIVGMHIDEGHFGDVKLDGLRWAAVAYWPGPLYEGNGRLQAIIDERADESQRDALLTILSGQEQGEGTFFQILSLIISEMLEPKFLPIDFEFDLDGRTARLAAPDLFEAASEPIKNPVTGDPHRILVNLPEGFEYKEAEVASATIKSRAAIKFESSSTHSSLAYVEHTPSGLA